MLSLWIFLTVLSAQNASEPQWPAITARLDQAVLAENIDAIRAVHDECLRLEPSPLVRYAIAYANWRMVYHPSMPASEREKLLDNASTQLELAVKVNDRFAEGHGLLASVLGMKIGESMWRGITLGPKAGSTIARATSLEPDNPRIVLHEGVGAFHTPSLFGGGIEKAERLLRRSIALFAQESSSKVWPAWGRFDAHAWLGQVLVKRGDFSGARAEYDKALEISPKSAWLRFVLIPAMEKAAKKQ